MPLIVDHEDFQKVTWPIRDWASKRAEFVSITVIEVDGISPGATKSYTMYTVPAGKVFYWTDLVQSFTTYSRCRVYIEGGAEIFRGCKEAEGHISVTLTTPLVFTENTTVKLDITNVDIITCYFSTVWIAWQTAASIPANPKDDSSKERFKVCDYNYCTKYYLSNNEVAILFHKLKENKRNYLRLENHGTPEEKVISQFHLTPEETSQVMGTMKEKPEEILKTLNKFDKYKK